MKRSDLYLFRDGLESADFHNPKVVYAITKNKRLVKSEIEDMEKVIEPSKKLKEYFSKKEEIAQKYTPKENNRFKTRELFNHNTGKKTMVYAVDGEFNPQSPFNEEIGKLNEEYKGEIDDQKEKEKRYNEEFLNEISEFIPFQVSIEEFNGEKCDQNVIDLIHWMIKD